MNRENILRLADAIENASLAPHLGFNMNYTQVNRRLLNEPGMSAPDHTGKDCGTVACIAGWACALQDFDWLRHPWDTFRRAQVWLDIDDAQADELFEPNALSNWREITTVQAVTTLRRLADTGLVVWEPTKETRRVYEP